LFGQSSSDRKRRKNEKKEEKKKKIKNEFEKIKDLPLDHPEVQKICDHLKKIFAKKIKENNKRVKVLKRKIDTAIWFYEKMG